MGRKIWVFDATRGGTAISDAVKLRTIARLNRYAEQNFSGRYKRLDFRFKRQFCYIDAFVEPQPSLHSANDPETELERLERLRNIPVYLGRLRYFGREDEWGFAFYSYSSEKYELSTFQDGSFLGAPESAFEISAQAYLE